MNNTITMLWLNRQLYVLIFIILNRIIFLGDVQHYGNCHFAVTAYMFSFQFADSKMFFTNLRMSAISYVLCGPISVSL